MTTPPAAAPLVTLDLQAVQSPGYKERGIARYALDFANAVCRYYPEVLDQVVLREDLPPVGRIGELVATGAVTNRPDWSPRPGGVFHALSPFDLDVPLQLVWPRPAFAHRWPFVVTVYDLIPDKFPEIYLLDAGIRRRYQVRREITRAADHIMTLSRAVAADVHERLEVPRERISVVGAACAPQFTRADNRAEAEQRVRTLVPGVGARTIVYNGAVEPRKNMERLVGAFARLPSKVRSGVQLVLVCRLEPLQQQHFEHLAQKLGVGGQLLLTGEVTDDALVALYRTAELVVYPSIAEGYGLPVVEAMACGAPAVASGNSSLAELVAPEATFDPFSEDAIAEAIARPLSDPSWRSRLVEWSARPRQTWRDVAGAAVGVYADVLARPKGHSPDRVAPASKRRTIAFVTPWPPSTSGVAVYSSRLVVELARDVDVEVFADGDEEVVDDAELLGGRIVTRPARSFSAIEAARGGYDAVIVSIGNSEHCAVGLSLIRRAHLEPLTILHDIRLTDLYRHGVWRGAVPEGFSEALTSIYGEVPPGVVEDGWIRPEVAERHGILMAREVIAKSSRVLVSSEFAARLAATDARADDRSKIVVVPLAYPDPVSEPGERDARLVGSFGLVNQAKRPLLLVQAVAALREKGTDLRLVFAGPVSMRDREEIVAEAIHLGIEGRVDVTGHLETSEYFELLSRVAVAVQLRARTNGESSAATNDCIARGVPVVVSDLGAARELPDFVEKVRADATADELTFLLDALLSDAPRRHAMSESGVAWAQQHGFANAADRILSFLQFRVADELAS